MPGWPPSRLTRELRGDKARADRKSVAKLQEDPEFVEKGRDAANLPYAPRLPVLEGAFVYRAWSVEQAMSDADDAESATPAGSHIRERLLRQSQTQSGHGFLGFLLTISSPAELIVNPCKEQAREVRLRGCGCGGLHPEAGR